jgi:hypothetical protein
MTTSGGRGPCRVCGKSSALRWNPDAKAFVTHTHGYRSTPYLASNYCEGGGDAPAGKPSIKALAHVIETYEHEPTKTRPGDQPLPTVNDAPYVQDQVMAFIERRKQVGIQRYGTALQPNNGRDAMLDAFEEAVDLAIYLGQVIIERDGKLP